MPFKHGFDVFVYVLDIVARHLKAETATDKVLKLRIWMSSVEQAATFLTGLIRPSSFDM
jgi:hypothetical protein